MLAQLEAVQMAGENMLQVARATATSRHNYMTAPQLSTANRRDCIPSDTADTRHEHSRRKKEAQLQASPCSLQVNVISSVTIDTAEYSPQGRTEAISPTIHHCLSVSFWEALQKCLESF